jgi:hypothetical protein
MIQLLCTQNRRNLVLVDNPSDLVVAEHDPAVALLSVKHERELPTVDDFVAALVMKGCLEICCAGPLAGQLHDHVDALLEGHGWLNIVTVAVEDPSEASEYFLYAANGAVGNLLAWINGDLGLREALLLELAG